MLRAVNRVAKIAHTYPITLYDSALYVWNRNGGLDTKTTPAKSAHITITRNIPQGSFNKMKDSAITITGELNMIVVASPIGNFRKL